MDIGDSKPAATATVAAPTIPAFFLDGWKFVNQDQFNLLFLSLWDKTNSLLQQGERDEAKELLYRWMAWGVSTHPQALMATFTHVVNGGHYVSSISDVMTWLDIPCPHDKTTNFDRVRTCIQTHINKYFSVGKLAKFRRWMQPLVPVTVASVNGGMYTISDTNGQSKVSDLSELQPNW